MSLSPRAQALFDDAREASEQPEAGVPDDARARMRANVLAAAAVGGATAAATAAKAATATATANAAKATGAATATKAAAVAGSLSAGKAVLGFVAAAGITFGGLTILDQQQGPAMEPAPATTSAPARTAEEPSTPEPAPPVAEEDDTTDDADDADPPGTTTEPTKRNPAPTAVPAETLEEQAALLLRARDAIRQGQHARAQALLDSYRQKYGKGALGEEQEALGVLNLCGSGDPRGPEAAKRFATRHPGSPLLQRIEQSCR